MPNIERLTQLRRVVAAAPKDLFHMRSVEEKTDCGTARCAIGWAYYDQWFQKEGIGDAVFNLPTQSIHLGSSLDWAALPKFFDITRDQSNALFGAELSTSPYLPRRVTRAHVISRIDRLIAGKPIRPYPSIAN